MGWDEGGHCVPIVKQSIICCSHRFLIMALKAAQAAAFGWLIRTVCNVYLP